MVRPLVLVATLLSTITGCSRLAKDDPAFAGAVECIGQDERCVIDKLGPADEERLGPNPFDKQLVYTKAQITVKLMRRGDVFGVGTGVAPDVHHFSGPYDGRVLGVRRGDSIADVEKRWGPGEQPSDPGARSPYRYYPKKLRTRAGRDVDVTVHYANTKEGVWYIEASRALESR